LPPALVRRALRAPKSSPLADVQRQWAIDNPERRRANNRRWRAKRLGGYRFTITPTPVVPVYQREIARLGPEAIAEAAKRRNAKRRKPTPEA
jgi:hypothetical protein